MSSRRELQSKRNENRKNKNVQVDNTKSDSEPIWAFDSEHDVATILGQNLFECILSSSSVSMSSYSNLVDNTNDDLKKSDFTVLLTASLLQRLDMKQESNKFLSLSDNVEKLYKSLGLDDKMNNNMFATMITILCPELIKQIEMAMITAISKNTRKTTVTHTESRMISAMRSISLTKDTTPNDLNIAYQAASQSNSRMILDVPIAETTTEDDNLNIDETDIKPEESVSNRNSSTNNKAKLNTLDIMEFIRNNRASNNKCELFNDKFKPVKKPIEPKPNNTRKGLGFSDNKASPNNNLTSKLSDAKKIESLEQELLAMQRNHAEEESESELSIL